MSLDTGDQPEGGGDTPGGSEYKLSDAVTLYNQQVTLNYGLWTVYVAVTFALAGFGAEHVTKTIAAILTPGFLAFTASNIYLIRRSLLLQATLKKDINTFFSIYGSGYFKRSINRLVEPAGSVMASYVVHGIIDICALAALWCRATGAMPIFG